MTLVWRSGFQFDDDAATYIQAVEAADTQVLEANVRYAINNFVLGCKSDGIWSAIKASCILAGARTLSGALVPLVGTAPTNVNFVAGDYNRKTGLVGNGSTKYLNTNRAANAQSQNNQHFSIYGSSLDTSTNVYIGSSGNGAPKNGALFSTSSINFYFNNQIPIITNQLATLATAAQETGFAGSSRSGVATTTGRRNGTNYTNSESSVSPSSDNYFVFASNTNGTANYFSSARLAFYSIGESLDLALLDTRVTALINAIAAAIP
jgi:hypothetical protein